MKVYTVVDSSNITGKYEKSVLFHCYWSGNLTEKHLYSILSCYYFNVHNNKHKIILWLESNVPNEYNAEIEKYAEIREYSMQTEIASTQFLHDYSPIFASFPKYANFVRTLLLYNYGGIWFDLDCFFLRSFDPIFVNFETEICLYRWENQKYPNNAIYMSLEAKSLQMKKNIEYIKKRNKGWGFQEAMLTYDLPLDMLILPYEWFDAGWINKSNKRRNAEWNAFFENTDKTYDFDNFHKGCFCYHWHNRWEHNIERNSIMMQLVRIIYGLLG